MKGLMKGQFSIAGIFMAFVLVIMLVTILPVQQTFLDNFVENETADAATKTIIALVPLFEVLGVIAFLVMYFMPERQTPQM